MNTSLNTHTDMTQLLANMRAMKAQAMSPDALALSSELATSNVSKNNTTAAVDNDFSSMFKQAIDHVNAVQKESGALKKSFEQGDPRVDLTQVMVASQKASIAFQATLSVRNKLVDAYKEVMNMPI